MAPVQRKNKKYDLNFKLSAVKYAEENSGEAAARRFSVDPKRVRDWRKHKTELRRLSEEDSRRARLRGGGRKKASEQLELHVRDWVIGKRARGERVTRRMIRARAREVFATVSDSGDERGFSASAGWLNRFLRRNDFACRRRAAVARRDAGEFTETPARCVNYSPRTVETEIPERDIGAVDETAVCSRTVAADGSEDHLIHCFTEGAPCAAGREVLAQVRRREEEEEDVEFNIEVVIEDDEESDEDDEEENDEGDDDE